MPTQPTTSTSQAQARTRTPLSTSTRPDQPSPTPTRTNPASRLLTTTPEITFTWQPACNMSLSQAGLLRAGSLAPSLAPPYSRRSHLDDGPVYSISPRSHQGPPRLAAVGNTVIINFGTLSFMVHVVGKGKRGWLHWLRWRRPWSVMPREEGKRRSGLGCLSHSLDGVTLPLSRCYLANMRVIVEFWEFFCSGHGAMSWVPPLLLGARERHNRGYVCRNENDRLTTKLEDGGAGSVMCRRKGGSTNSIRRFCLVF